MPPIIRPLPSGTTPTSLRSSTLSDWAGIAPNPSMRRLWNAWRTIPEARFTIRLSPLDSTFILLPPRISAASSSKSPPRSYAYRSERIAAASSHRLQRFPAVERKWPADGVLDAPQPYRHIVVLRTPPRECFRGFEYALHNIPRSTITARVNSRQQATESPFLAAVIRSFT